MQSDEVEVRQIRALGKGGEVVILQGDRAGTKLGDGAGEVNLAWVEVSAEPVSLGQSLIHRRKPLDQNQGKRSLGS